MEEETSDFYLVPSWVDDSLHHSWRRFLRGALSQIQKQRKDGEGSMLPIIIGAGVGLAFLTVVAYCFLKKKLKLNSKRRLSAQTKYINDRMSDGMAPVTPTPDPPVQLDNPTPIEVQHSEAAISEAKNQVIQLREHELNLTNHIVFYQTELQNIDPTSPEGEEKVLKIQALTVGRIQVQYYLAQLIKNYGISLPNGPIIEPTKPIIRKSSLKESLTAYNVKSQQSIDNDSKEYHEENKNVDPNSLNCSAGGSTTETGTTIDGPSTSDERGSLDEHDTTPVAIPSLPRSTIPRLPNHEGDIIPHDSQDVESENITNLQGAPERKSESVRKSEGLILPPLLDLKTLILPDALLNVLPNPGDKILNLEELPKLHTNQGPISIKHQYSHDLSNSNGDGKLLNIEELPKLNINQIQIKHRVAAPINSCLDSSIMLEKMPKGGKEPIIFNKTQSNPVHNNYEGTLHLEEYPKSNLNTGPIFTKQQYGNDVPNHKNGKQPPTQGRLTSSGRFLNGPPPTSLMVLCANCRAKLYAPPPGTLFKCPHCEFTQMMPDCVQNNPSNVAGISCNVPDCSCLNYKEKIIDKTTDRMLDHLGEEGEGMCECGHTRTLHKISIDDVSGQLEFPPYWVGDLSKSCRAQVTDEVKEAVQNLMDTTYKNITTMDRDGKAIPCRYEVVQVLRNQNPVLWTGYWLKREVIRQELNAKRVNDCVAGDDPDTGLTELTSITRNFIPGESSDDAAILDIEGCNELYLFHGTKPSAADAICEGNFEIKKTGSNRGTLYGPGIYFAESSSKSDEYAEDDGDGIYQGLYATLLCRVVMGHWNYNDQVKPDPNEVHHCLRGKYHSLLGDREKCRNTFREYVVYDKDQAYPEFIIIYRRRYD